MAAGNETISYAATRADKPPCYAAIDLGIVVEAVNAQNLFR